MKRRFSTYDPDADVDARKLQKAESKEDMTPDEYRLAKYGVDGTKIFICQVTKGVFTVKALGKQKGATTKQEIVDIVAKAVTERFGLE